MKRILDHASLKVALGPGFAFWTILREALPTAGGGRWKPDCGLWGREVDIEGLVKLHKSIDVVVDLVKGVFSSLFIPPDRRARRACDKGRDIP